MWNFKSWQVKFNILRLLNEPTQRIFYYLLRQLWRELSKIDHFRFSKPIPKTVVCISIPRDCCQRFETEAKIEHLKNMHNFCPIDKTLWLLPTHIWDSPIAHREFWFRNGIGIIGLWKRYILLYELGKNWGSRNFWNRTLSYLGPS